MFEYSGSIHIHSRHSDGSGSLPTIVEAARQAGPDFIIISDHNNMSIREEGAPGWFGDLLVLIGEEVSPPFNHYLAIGLKEPIEPNYENTQANIEAVAAQDAIGFIAHPFPFHQAYPKGSRLAWLSKKVDSALYPWRDWNVNGFTGMEVWQYMYDWMKFMNHFNAITHIVAPQRFMTGPTPRTIRTWDELNKRRKVVGIGVVDAHGRPSMLRILPVFSYRYLFSTVRTHILTHEPFTCDVENDERVVVSALRHGSCFFANDRVADSSGFRFYLRSDGVPYYMGDECLLGEEMEIMVILPEDGEIRIICDGKLIVASTGESLCKTIEQRGSYRVEVRRKGRAWIFSNPIYVV